MLLSFFFLISHLKYLDVTIDRKVNFCHLPPSPSSITGGFFSSLFSKLWGAKELRILILGLDGAGKTTILYRLQVGEVVTTIPSELTCAHTSELTCARTSELSSFDIYSSNFPHHYTLLCNYGELFPTLPPSHLPALSSPCLTAIGFNVETVTYKNLKFQGLEPTLYIHLYTELVYAQHTAKKEKTVRGIVSVGSLLHLAQQSPLHYVDVQCSCIY